MNDMVEKVEIEDIENAEDTVNTSTVDLSALGLGDYHGVVNNSPLKAIRAHCIECSGGELREAKLCTATKCPLWCFRMGKNPFRKGREYTEEEKIAARERLAKARMSK